MFKKKMTTALLGASFLVAGILALQPAPIEAAGSFSYDFVCASNGEEVTLAHVDFVDPGYDGPWALVPCDGGRAKIIFNNSFNLRAGMPSCWNLSRFIPIQNPSDKPVIHEINVDCLD